MRKFRPLSRKIIISILVPLIVLLSVTLAFSRWSVSDQVRGRIDQDILKQMKELELLASNGINPETGDPFLTSDSLLETFLGRAISNTNETMFGLSGAVVTFRSLGNEDFRPDKDAGFLDQVLEPSVPSLGTYQSEIGELRYGVYPVIGLDDNLGKLVIATNVDAELEGTNSLFRNLVVGLIALFTLTALLLSYIVKRSLQPITELTAAAQNVSKDNFLRPLTFEANKTEDEVTQLGIEFNNMLTRLETSFVDQQRFIDDAGHELRTPLTILKGHVELLKSEGILSQSLDIIDDEINRMSRLVQDLQSLTKATQPNFVQMHEFASDVFIKEVAEKSQSIYSNPIELEQYDSNFMYGDKQRLTQAMLQLIENAVKYSAPHATIAIGLQILGHSAVMYVKDVGQGITDEAKQSVFQRFYQVDNTSSEHDTGGIGLGLAIVKAIVDGHKGTISITDNFPQGSVFKISIPQERPSK